LDDYSSWDSSVGVLRSGKDFQNHNWELYAFSGLNQPPCPSLVPVSPATHLNEPLDLSLLCNEEQSMGIRMNQDCSLAFCNFI